MKTIFSLLLLLVLSIQAQGLSLTVVVPINDKTTANTYAAMFDTKGGTKTFLVELNTKGGALDAPATYLWCSYASVTKKYADDFEAQLKKIPGSFVYRDISPQSVLDTLNLQPRQAVK